MNLTDLKKVAKLIPWNLIEGVEGIGKIDVPSRYDAESKDALRWEYEQEFYHNGFTYEGAFYILPLLIQGIKIENNLEKQRAYDNINTILGWSSAGESFCSFEINNAPFKYYTPSIKGKAIKMPLDMACEFAIFNEIEFFIADLKENVTGKREEAIDLIAKLDGYPKFVVNKLLQTIKDADDNKFKDYIIPELIYFNDVNKFLVKEELLNRIEVAKTGKKA